MLNNEQRNLNMGAMAPGQPGAPGGVTNIGGIEINHEEAKAKARAHLNEKVLKVDETDKAVWALMTNVPRINKNLAMVCAVLNVIIPGSGTLLAACSA